jgi:hypothetical protein
MGIAICFTQRYPFEKGLGGSQGRSVHSGEDKIHFPAEKPAQLIDSHYTIRVEVSRLLLHIYNKSLSVSVLFTNNRIAMCYWLDMGSGLLVTFTGFLGNRDSVTNLHTLQKPVGPLI